jgi:hypothetical protein
VQLLSSTEARPLNLAVLPHHPNPLAHTATLQIGLADAGRIDLDIFDVSGRRVSGRSFGLVEAGWRTVARDDAGRPLPSGVYFYTLRAGGEAVTRKMIVTR